MQESWFWKNFVKFVETKNTQVRTIDDGFQFYEALLTLDLSDNMIETIQDGAFQSQVIFIFIVIGIVAFYPSWHLAIFSFFFVGFFF